MVKRVTVGMSGGVDSSVSALLLLEAGYEVSGLFMKNWDEDDGTEFCTAREDLEDAASVCDRLGIPLKTCNFAAEYWDRVFEVGADLIATGHYARVTEDAGRYHLLKGLDGSKDQSYFIYTLGQTQLSKTLFPIGGLQKVEVRAMAQKAGFDNARKRDSTGICFIGERRFKTFLQRYLPAQPGTIETEEGQVVGRHEGLMYYTLGQRRGFGVGGIRGQDQEAWYVLAKDLERNVLIVGQGHDHPLGLSDTLEAGTLDWCDNGPPEFPVQCKAKTRYRQEDQACWVESIGDERCLVRFETPQRAVTPGQSVVFYQEDRCLGGGIIEETRFKGQKTGLIGEAA